MKKLFLLTMVVFCTHLNADKKIGQELYLMHCATCHSINMSGSFGKDFNLVSYTRTKKEIIAYAQNPGSMYRSFGYSSNAMPTLPLNGEELSNLADYIDSLQPFKKWMKK